MSGNYGKTQDPVNGTVFNGLYAHRVIQDPNDTFGGLVCFRTSLTGRLTPPPRNKNGINNTTLEIVYV